MLLLHIILLIFLCAINVDFTTCGCKKSFVVICDGLSHVQYNDKKKTWTELLIQARNYEEDIPPYTLSNQQLTRDLSQLKWLVITEHLTVVDKSAFVYLKNLQQLILYGNNIPNIKKLTFAAFRNLFKLGLEKNNIQQMEAGSFYSSKIDVVDLSYNQLQVLTTGLFNKRCAINTLRITNNRLWKIDSNSLPRSLKNLNLDHNSLVSLPQELNNLKQLEELTLSHNNLDDVDVSQLGSLTKLDLSFNKITSVSHQFDNLVKLKYLDLSGNRLEKFTFSPQLLQNFKEHFFLLLAHNRLRNLNLESIRKEITLTLSGNPWNCKCMEKMQQVIQKNNLTTTACEQRIVTAGLNPYCIVDGYGKCSEYRVSETVMEKFRNGYQDSICDIFSDVDTFVQ